MVDTFQIISYPVHYSAQYPLLYSLLLSNLYNLFLDIFKTPNIAFFTTSIVQNIIISSMISYSISWFHKKTNSNKATLILILYFSFTTVITSMNTTIIRDPFFSCFMLLFTIMLYELYESNGKKILTKSFIIKLIIIASLMCLVRNNGIYIFLFVFVILFIIYKKYYKQLFITLIGISLITNISLFFPEQYKTEPLFMEKVAIPIQQLAYTLKYDSLSKEDEKYLNTLFPKKNMIKEYNPFFVDDIKWSMFFGIEYLNETKEQFMDIWFRNLPSHLESYIKSYLLTTSGLWSIQNFSKEQSFFTGLELGFAQFYFKDIDNEPILPKKLQNTLNNYYKITGAYFNNGACFYIFIITMLCAIYKRKKTVILCGSPLIANWITLMIACPLSSAFRYMSPFGYILPFLIFILLIQHKDCIIVNDVRLKK